MIDNRKYQRDREYLYTVYTHSCAHRHTWLTWVCVCGTMFSKKEGVYTMCILVKRRRPVYLFICVSMFVFTKLKCVNDGGLVLVKKAMIVYTRVKK